METLFWILVFLFALVAAWRVILMSATFPLPAAPRNIKLLLVGDGPCRHELEARARERASRTGSSSPGWPPRSG